jgi:hypothetical protein
MGAIFHPFVYIKENENCDNKLERKQDSTKIPTKEGHNAGDFS